MARKTCQVRVSKNTKDILSNYKRELEVIEKDDVPLGEVIDRMSKGDDMLPRLKRGSLERRRTK